MSRALLVALTRRHGPMTAKQLALESGLCESTVRTCIRRARAHGTEHLRIADWASDVPMYGPGPDEDVEGGTTAQKVIACLQDGGPATVATIATRLGLTNSVVDSAVRRMRAKPGTLHVVRWVRQVGRGGREAAVFALGVGKDAPRPNFEDAQRQAERRYNEKRRVASESAGKGRYIKREAPRARAGFFDGLIARS